MIHTIERGKQLSTVPRRYDAAVIVAFAVLLLAPAAMGPGGSDLLVQSLRARSFVMRFWNGEFYPRWLMDMFAGNGSPNMFFSPPMAYWAAAVFYPIVGLGAFSYHVISSSAFAAVALSGFTFRLWVSDATGRPTPISATLLFMAFPFHVLYSFYLILLMGTVWAYTWAPLLMYYAGRLASGQRLSVIGFGASLALLILSNVPATVILAPAACVYALMVRPGTRDGLATVLLRLAAGSTLGLGLSAFYLYPAVALAQFTIIHMMLDGAMPAYVRSFVVPGLANWQQAIYFTVWLALLCLGIYLFAAGKGGQRQRAACVTIASLGLVFMLDVFRPLWHELRPLQLLQHPARLFLLPSCFLPVLAAFAMPKVKGLVWVLVIASVAATFWVGVQTRTSEAEVAQASPDLWEAYRKRVEQYPVFLPSESLIPRYFTRRGLASVPQDGPRVEVLSGTAAIDIRLWEPRHIALDVASEGYVRLRLRQHYFHGFTGMVNGAWVILKPDPHTGQILMDVPPVKGTVFVDLNPEESELWGRLASIAAALIVLAVVFVRGGAMARSRKARR